MSSNLRNTISTACSYQSELECMMQQCPVTLTGDFTEANDVLANLNCICQDCPSYGTAMANLDGFVSLWMSGNAQMSSLMAELCSYVGPMSCVYAQSSCSGAARHAIGFYLSEM